MSDQLKPGDVVRLKSGGPSMTVDEIIDEWGLKYLYCSWFDQNRMNRDRFPESSLVKD